MAECIIMHCNAVVDKKLIQLSQTGRAMPRVIEYFAQSRKLTQSHWKFHSIDRIEVPSGVP